MTLSKGALRTITRALLADSEKQAWHDAVLDIVISSSLDKLASNLLDFSPWFKSVRVIIPASNMVGTVGAWLISSLGSATPQAARVYKIQNVTRNGQTYTPVSNTSVTNAPELGFNSSQIVTAPAFTYTVRDDWLALYPFDATTDATVTWNYLPKSFISLADTDNVDFPDGFELAISHDVVMQLSNDAQTIANSSRKRDEMLDAIYSKIKRPYVGPAVMNAIDDALSWSSI